MSVTRGSDITDYVGNKIYENGSLKRILVDGGYWESGEYHFYIQDHQGNNRVVARGLGNGTVVQTNHYYPFGMTFGEVAASEQDKQAYKYNGKELDRKNGLNLYDYSARYMEPALGRFTTMDPHAENYYAWSPYHYAGNSPVNITDPTGMDWYEDKEGNKIWRKSQDKEYIDDNGSIWKNIGTQYLFQRGNRATLFQQTENKKGELGLKSTSLDVADESQAELDAKRVAIDAQLSTSTSRRAANKWRNDPTFSNLVKFYIAEIGGQYTDPVRVVGGLSVGIVGYSSIVSSNYKYAARVRMRGMQDPVSHNFPYSFDNAILRTTPKVSDSGYRLYQLRGSMNGKNGFFEIGRTKDGIINHRFFRPN